MKETIRRGIYSLTILFIIIIDLYADFKHSGLLFSIIMTFSIWSLAKDIDEKLV